MANRFISEPLEGEVEAELRFIIYWRSTSGYWIMNVSAAVEKAEGASRVGCPASVGSSDKEELSGGRILI